MTCAVPREGPRVAQGPRVALDQCLGGIDLWELGKSGDGGLPGGGGFWREMVTQYLWTEEGGSIGRHHLGSQGTEASVLGKAAVVEIKVNLMELKLKIGWGPMSRSLNAKPGVSCWTLGSEKPSLGFEQNSGLIWDVQRRHAHRMEQFSDFNKHGEGHVNPEDFATTNVCILPTPTQTCPLPAWHPSLLLTAIPVHLQV